MSFAIGADVGGTTMPVVLTTMEGVPVREIWRPQSFSDASGLIDALGQAVEECRSVSRARGVPVVAFGLSLAAWLNHSRAHVVQGAEISSCPA